MVTAELDKVLVLVPDLLEVHFREFGPPMIGKPICCTSISKS